MAALRFKPRDRSRFVDVVRKLSEKYSWQLLSLVRESPGVTPRLTRKWREAKIDELQDLVEKAHRPGVKKWIAKHAYKQEVFFRRKIEKNDKAIHVRDHLAKTWNPRHPVVYASFKTRRRCLKVGRSDHGLGRIASQSFAYYFRDARRVVVFFPKRKKRKVLPSLECALTHLYRPFHLYTWPAEKKFLSKCRTCRDMKLVKKIIRARFPL